MTETAMITLAAAGRRINKSPATLVKWSANGDFPQLLIFGRRRYVLEAVFHDWWQARTRAALSPKPENGNDSRAPA